MEELDRKMYGGNDEPMSLGDWIVTLLLMCIPIANIVLLFVWGFSSNVNTNKKNYSRAMLIFMAIGFVLWIILASAFAAMFANTFHSLPGNLLHN